MKRFMRKILLLCVACMALLSARAQVAFGVRAGGAYSSLIQKVNDRAEAGSRFGFSVAGVADIPLSANKRWSLRPEVALVHQGGAYYSDQDLHGMALHNKCWYYSLQVPVNVAYTFRFTDIFLSVFAGPSFDWSFYGKMKSRETNPDLHFGISEEKDLKPCDMGINIGLTVECNKFFLSLSSICGVIDRRATKREGETSVYQNNVTLSVGYFFRR